MARVLIPLDGSAESERSLNCLGFLRRLPNVKLDLLRVREAEDDPASEAEIRDYLAARAADVRERFDIAVETRIGHGPPFLAILAEADSQDVSLVVIATRGRGGITRHGVGSVTDRITRYAPCPTLVLAPPCSKMTDEIETIIVPLDGSRLAEESLPAATILAQTLRKPVLLLRVVGTLMPSETAVRQLRQEEAEAYLRDVQTRLPAAIEVQLLVLTGPPVETLLAELRAHPRGILVMGAHGGEGFRSYAVGRVTDELLLSTPIPVLLVEPGQSQRLINALHA